MGKQDTHISNLKVLIIGCTPLARKVIKCVDEGFNLVGVVNLHPDLGLSKSNYDPLTDICNPFFTRDINDKQTEEWIRSHDPEVIIQCGWSQIFKKNILRIPGRYCLGIHPSPLPEGRGAAVINWKIIESDGKPVDWANSLFVMEEKTDMGPVISSEPFTIDPRDDIRTAYQKVDQTAVKMISRTLLLIAGGIETLIPQDNSKATRYYKRKPEDGKIDLSWSAVKVNDFVRALTHPYPGAFIETLFGKLFVWKSSIDVCKVHGDPGLVCGIVRSKGILVKTGDFNCVWLERVSVDGVEMWADDWAIHQNLKVGVNLVEK